MMTFQLTLVALQFVNFRGWLTINCINVALKIIN